MTRTHNPSHPGEVLQDTVLSEITVSEFGKRLGVSRVALSRVVDAHAAGLNLRHQVRGLLDDGLGVLNSRFPDADELGGLRDGFRGVTVAAFGKPFPRIRGKGFLMTTTAFYATNTSSNLPLLRLLLQRRQHLHRDHGELGLAELTTVTQTPRSRIEQRQPSLSCRCLRCARPAPPCCA